MTAAWAAASGAISTHVLDAAAGHPAGGIAVTLERLDSTGWMLVSASATAPDGRLTDLAGPGPLRAASYRLTFDVRAYYAATGTPAFYPQVVVVFEVADPAQHYHVPLLLSPFAYSTYRGS